jgi:hypothetical protein
MVKLQDLVKQYPAIDVTMRKIFEKTKVQPHLIRVWGNNQYFHIRFGYQQMFPFDCLIEPNGAVYYSHGMWDENGWNELLIWARVYSKSSNGLQIDKVIGGSRPPNMIIAHNILIDKIIITSDGYSFLHDDSYLNAYKKI